jgi:hypothetical protein
VKRAEDEEPRFRGCQCQGNGFEISHLTDENDVRILAQCSLQAGSERGGMLGNLALGDNALLVAMNEFDRLLDGHDVTAVVGIDVIDQGRKGGTLAGTGGTGH